MAMRACRIDALSLADGATVTPTVTTARMSVTVQSQKTIAMIGAFNLNKTALDLIKPK